MSPQARVYCYRCRRSLSPKAFNRKRWERLPFQVCETCVNQLRSQGLTMTPTTALEDERMIQAILQEREGGEREVESPVGYVDLLTDEYVIEVKHVKVWKDGTKVLLYAPYFPGRKPRVHLFGGYSKDFRTLVENSFEKLGITTTWEREPF